MIYITLHHSGKINIAQHDLKTSGEVRTDIGSNTGRGAR